MSDTKSYQAPEASEITRCLSRVAVGEEGAEEQLLELAYDRLRVLASRVCQRLWNPSRAGTQTVLHESLCKLSLSGMNLNGSEHFFRLANKAMKEVLINLGERSMAQKRTPEGGLVPLDAAGAVVEVQDVINTIALAEALEELRSDREELHQVSVLIGLYGCKMEEAAEILGVGRSTAVRWWAVARIRLARILTSTARQPS